MNELTPLKKEPFLRIKVPIAAPSLNALFSANPWGRQRAKKMVQAAFISALQQGANDSSILIILSQSTSLTASAMLEQFQTTLKNISASKLTKKKLANRKKRL